MYDNVYTRPILTSPGSVHGTKGPANHTCISLLLHATGSLLTLQWIRELLGRPNAGKQWVVGHCYRQDTAFSSVDKLTRCETRILECIQWKGIVVWMSACISSTAMCRRPHFRRPSKCHHLSVCRQVHIDCPAQVNFIKVTWSLSRTE